MQVKGRVSSRIEAAGRASIGMLSLQKFHLVLKYKNKIIQSNHLTKTLFDEYISESKIYRFVFIWDDVKNRYKQMGRNSEVNSSKTSDSDADVFDPLIPYLLLSLLIK